MKIQQNNELLKKTNIAGVILKPKAPELKDVYLKIKNEFEKVGIKILLEFSSARMIKEENGIHFEQLCTESDFLITVGGDGTLISVTRRSVKYNKAVLGINLGKLGFLTDIIPDKLDIFVNDFLQKRYRIDTRMMINATIDMENYISFNDIVVTRKSISHMVNIEAKVDGKLFNRYYGDGLIISTPTGSTAYNLSAGGPVIFPLTDAFVVTPICPHSLTQRPLILPSQFELELSSLDKEGAVVIIDGQNIIELSQNETVKIKVASQQARLIRSKTRDYFDVLNTKLNWGQS